MHNVLSPNSIRRLSSACICCLAPSHRFGIAKQHGNAYKDRWKSYMWLISHAKYFRSYARGSNGPLSPESTQKPKIKILSPQWVSEWASEQVCDKVLLCMQTWRVNDDVSIVQLYMETMARNIICTHYYVIIWLQYVEAIKMKGGNSDGMVWYYIYKHTFLARHHWMNQGVI